MMAEQSAEETSEKEDSSREASEEEDSDEEPDPDPEEEEEDSDEDEGETGPGGKGLEKHDSSHESSEEEDPKGNWGGTGREGKGAGTFFANPFFVNPWWAHVVAENGVATPLFPKVCAKRSQDLDKTLIPTGAIWIADSDKLVSQQTFYGTGFTMCELNWISAVDIDDEEDWKFAEFALRVRSEGLSL